jgi:hypothetical protein
MIPYMKGDMIPISYFFGTLYGRAQIENGK